MEIDTELQNLINEYVKQIEDKEEDLVGLKQRIDHIVSVVKQELKSSIYELDRKFDANKISEEEYLIKLRVEKESILTKTKEKLNSLIKSIEQDFT